MKIFLVLLLASFSAHAEKSFILEATTYNQNIPFMKMTGHMSPSLISFKTAPTPEGEKFFSAENKFKIKMSLPRSEKLFYASKPDRLYKVEHDKKIIISQSVDEVKKAYEATKVEREEQAKIIKTNADMIGGLQQSFGIESPLNPSTSKEKKAPAPAVKMGQSKIIAGFKCEMYKKQEDADSYSESCTISLSEVSQQLRLQDILKKYSDYQKAVEPYNLKDPFTFAFSQSSQQATTTKKPAEPDSFALETKIYEKGKLQMSLIAKVQDVDPKIFWPQGYKTISALDDEKARQAETKKMLEVTRANPVGGNPDPRAMMLMMQNKPQQQAFFKCTEVAKKLCPAQQSAQSPFGYDMKCTKRPEIAAKIPKECQSFF